MEILDDPILLRAAYAQGFFPMPHPHSGRIEWFRPDPRAILPLDNFHVSRSLRKRLSRGEYRVTFDRDFVGVMRGCAERDETWITGGFLRAYRRLHRLRWAHSVEVWKGTELVGGVYGVSHHGAFFAESKFHRATDASKVALYHLVQHLRERGFLLLEVQFLTAHLASLGVVEISGAEYLQRLREALGRVATFGEP